MYRTDLYLIEGNLSGAKDLPEKGLKAMVGKVSDVTIFGLQRLVDVDKWCIDLRYWSDTWPVLLLLLGLKLKNKKAVYEGFEFLGKACMTEGDMDTAANLLTLALDAFTYMDIHLSHAECMLRLGDIEQGHGNWEKAVGYWSASRPLFELSSQAKMAEAIDEGLAMVQPLREMQAWE